MKRRLALFICAVLIFGTFSSVSHADGGKIDLYQVFSNKEDQAKTEVGSRVYKWSMHLPDDAIIYKSDQVNYFSMSTTSYQSNVDLQVNKNKDNQTLEEILYQLQNQSKQGYYWLWGDKEFQVDITNDQWGQRYIRIIKGGGFYDYFLADKAAEEFREYTENRIYVANNNIYNLTVRMNGEFYKEHEEMFSKLVSSFKLSFDEKNPYIKELSDSVSISREYKNTSYGWKMVLSPYWKVEGTPNARNQVFRPVYTDEELDQSKSADAGKENEVNPEGITVSLIGSSIYGETADQGALKDIETLKNNYNPKVFEILKSEQSNQNNLKVYNLTVRFKTVTKKPYLMNNVYVIGNGYKYLISAISMEDKYLDSSKKASIDNMLKSFKLDTSCLSKYLGKITQAESLLDSSAPKNIKMKKYNFAANVTRTWNMDSPAMYIDGFFMNEEYNAKSDEGASNNEELTTFQPESNLLLKMTAGLNSNTMEKIISEKAKIFLSDDEISLGLAKVKIDSSEYNGAVIYHLTKEYDPEAINAFVNEDNTKVYNFEDLKNEYEYIVKVGKDVFIQTITMPVANTTQQNFQKVNSIWGSTTINNVNYSKLKLQWKQHTLQEYDKGAPEE